MNNQGRDAYPSVEETLHQVMTSGTLFGQPFGVVAPMMMQLVALVGVIVLGVLAQLGHGSVDQTLLGVLASVVLGNIVGGTLAGVVHLTAVRGPVVRTIAERAAPISRPGNGTNGIQLDIKPGTVLVPREDPPA